MTSKRWSDVERLYHEALERPRSERDAFLASACGRDGELRREVESLLAHADSPADELLEGGAMTAAAQLVSNPDTAFVSGRRIRVYELIAMIGAGGMGEVYRARDTRLGRDVAIKILPSAFTRDPDRVARFEREARMLAALKHPHIGAIYGLEDADDGTALVMELVEGEDLSQRLRRGPLPVPEALAVARQVADALDAAHEQGIIHRDLKPANVRIQPDGIVKVLDFGLAKPMPSAANHAPTLTAVSRVPHAVVGTPAYMSPEQARGEAVGRETDVWAFGILLYELLTGISPFARSSTTETLASVLTAAPDETRLPTTTPSTVRRFLRRCLEKDPKRRWRHMGDVRIEIEEALASPAAEAVPAPPLAAPAKRWLQAALVTGLVAAAGLVGWRWPRAEAPAQPVRLRTLLPVGVTVDRRPGFATSVAVSPDGRTLVVAGSEKDGQRLYRRHLDQLEMSPLAGTDGGANPFFSPDGAWIGFFAGGRMKRIPAGGGAAVDIVSIPSFPSGASWGPDNRIVFAYGAYPRLHIVDFRGGTVEALGAVETGRHPDAVSDGRSVLFESDGWIHVVDRVTGQHARLVQGYAPRYALGHVLFSRGTTLYAVPIDLTRRELTGPVVAFVEGVAAVAPGSGRDYESSPGGTLAYVSAADAYELVVVAPDGRERVVSERQRLLQNPRFSPNGTHIVVATTRREGEATDLWMHDIDSGAATRLTSDGGRAPIWSPDGADVTYSQPGGGIYSRRADGHGEAKQLVALNAFHWLVGWSPDHRSLVYGLMDKTPSSIMAHRDGQSRRVVGGYTWGGRLSSDGRWLVYYWLDAGAYQVYVTPFPEAGTRWLIAEGTDPTWSPDGNEIYYRSGSRLMAARVDKTVGVRVTGRRLVLEPFLPPLYDDYDIHPDGRTLAIVRPANPTQGREVTIVLHWHEALKQQLSQR